MANKKDLLQALDAAVGGGGATRYLTTYGQAAGGIKAQMEANSAKWHTASTQKERDDLHAENQRLSDQLKAMGGTVNYDRNTGRWYGTAGTPDAPSRQSFSYGSAPSYVNKYQGKLDALAQALLNREAFSYDPETDPLYQQYRASYERGGRRAMQDTLGEVSARTGGIASSYAAGAAQQAYDNYMAALSDKIPELRQLAYQMYRDEGNELRSNLSMLQGLDQSDYNKYLTELGQFNTDRSFAYNQFSDAQSYDLQLWQAIMNSLQQEKAYNRGVFESDRAYDYQAGRDQIGDQRYEQSYADSRSDAEYQRAMNLAGLLAESGDFSRYKELGMTDQEIASLNAWWQSQKLLGGSGGGYRRSGGGGGGGDGTADSPERLALYLAALQVEKSNGFPEDFINNNYKNYGFPSKSNLYSGYKAWKKANEQYWSEDSKAKGHYSWFPSTTQNNTVPDYEGLFQAALDYENENKNFSRAAKYFINTNYKKYGFDTSSTAYDSYKDWKAAQKRNAAKARTSFYYNPDDNEEKNIKWNGRWFSSFDELLRAIDAAGLTKQEKEELQKKFDLYLKPHDLELTF